jgi:hypothetical protein
VNATADSETREQPAVRLTDSQLKEVMRLIKGAHSVELKLTVPGTAHRATIQGLPMDPVEAQPRQIYFFDTPDLQLYRAGVVVRARRIAGGKGDTVVKLRPVEPSEVPADLRNDPSFNIEVDALPGGFVCSASFKGRSTAADVQAAVQGEIPLRKIFTKDQRAFYDLHAPAGIDMDSLTPLGPTFVLKAQRTPGELGRVLVGEMWLYQDGSRILELSTKCQPSEAFQVAAEARAFLSDRGVVIGGIQQAKTKAALEYFHAQLKAEAAEAEAEAAAGTTG